VLGRLTSDTVTTLGLGVDSAVQRIDTSYNALGLPEKLTSHASPSGGTPLNQVQEKYNGLGQLIAEYQAHSGQVVVGTTPVVQYAYSEMTSRVGNVGRGNECAAHRSEDGDMLTQQALEQRWPSASTTAGRSASPIPTAG